MEKSIVWLQTTISVYLLCYSSKLATKTLLYTEEGKVNLKSNGDEALSDESP